ncbi:hypothetical protein AMJ80_03305 [bacterium SM23_31]|nr:MAG: hypothetical protein AMJ80_03305 [bacterium SM23_31]
MRSEINIIIYMGKNTKDHVKKVIRSIVICATKHVAPATNGEKIKKILKDRGENRKADRINNLLSSSGDDLRK